MSSERLAKLESMLRQNPNLPEGSRKELLDLVAGLRSEMARLDDSHAETAHQIADHAEAALHASLKGSQPEQASQAAERLADSVREFEATHPRLVELVDQLAVTLSNMGI